ncbi:hypothetical protein KIW84_050154 [Lathyrus oleraceus]|uniref:Uncharacterized protein n=1 Tax=Pisum sativum TaxID=3888 RepID=A0A9D5AC28_PEA|nr:hypothetical protein KIW84_050154 [Pisum sativum]
MGYGWFVEYSNVDGAVSVLKNLRGCPGLFFQIKSSKPGNQNDVPFSIKPENHAMELVSPRINAENHSSGVHGAPFSQSNWHYPDSREISEAGVRKPDGYDHLSLDPHRGNVPHVHSGTRGPSIPPPPQQIQSSSFTHHVYAPPNGPWDPHGINNQFTGPIPFGITKYLSSLDLSYNHLSESIPEGLLSPLQLVLVDLSYNKLQGLQVLKLQMNKLNGIIPIQISQLQKLSTLNLSQNSLDGPIPSERTTNLTLLYLQGNKLNGSIPPSIGNLGQLLELQLGENQLSGDIPKMPWSLQIALNLSSNHFSGNIPSSFSDLVNLEVLDLSNNNFSGEIHVSLTKMATLTRLQLSNNRLSGDLPSFGSYVNVDTRGTDVKKNSDVPVNHSPSAEKSGKSVIVAVLIAIAAAFFVVGMVTLLVVLLSRHYCRGNNERVQASEGENFDLQIIQW